LGALRSDDARNLQHIFTSLKEYLKGVQIAISSNDALSSYVLKSGDIMTGPLTLNANPTSVNHAATKQYVDTGDSARVLKAGDTMTGLLTLSGNPTSNLHASTKQYVDTGVSNRVLKSGDTMTGTLTITGGSFSTNGNISLTGNGTRITQNSTATWSGGAGTGFGKLEYHSNRWYINAGSNSTEIVRFRRGESDVALMNNSGGIQAYSMQGIANVAGTGNAIYAPSGMYSTGTNWLYGQTYMNGNSIGTSGAVSHGAAQIYASDWFRSWGATGWYNQTYQGGIYMIDSTWIRTYNGKNFYTDSELRCGGRLSSNATRFRGSYGAISIGANGVTNTWDGIEFLGSPQTFMVQADFYSGMYRNNNAWNWLFYYSTLTVGSDARFKREIEPLNLGLNFIEKLEPVSFLKLTEECDDDPEATEPGYQFGFTAQNVRAALDECGETRDVKIHNIGGPNLGLVACTEDAVYDRQYIGITEFISPIVQAIKELNSKVKDLEQKNIQQNH
jgi:hypothetical protein